MDRVIFRLYLTSGHEYGNDQQLVLKSSITIRMSSVFISHPKTLKVREAENNIG